VYADWHGGERHMSEKTIGAWLKQASQRDHAIIATKGGHPDLATALIPRLAPEQIVSDLDQSLECLGIEQIDLYYLHRDDPNRPVGEILETLNQQIRLGKIRAIGCSNWQPERIRAAQAYATAHDLHPFIVSQLFWSLAIANPGTFASDHAVMEDAALAFYIETGMAVTSFTSQARGFFTKAAASGLDSLKPDRRRDFENPENIGRLARAQQLTQQLGVSVSAIVLAYITSQPIIGVPIIGPLSHAQLHDSLAAADLTLTPEQVRFLSGYEGAMS
jgi:aryl-alcohol dehydrogenase-like predicted oxidoreductase